MTEKWVKEQLDDNREAIDIWGEVNYEGRWDVGDKCNSFEDFKTFTEKLKKKMIPNPKKMIPNPTKLRMKNTRKFS